MSQVQSLNHFNKKKRKIEFILYKQFCSQRDYIFDSSKPKYDAIKGHTSAITPDKASQL